MLVYIAGVKALFYLINIICHFLPLFHHACGWVPHESNKKWQTLLVSLYSFINVCGSVQFTNSKGKVKQLYGVYIYIYIYSEKEHVYTYICCTSFNNIMYTFQMYIIQQLE